MKTMCTNRGTVTDNHIGNQGCKMICEALKSNSALTELDLSCNEKQKKESKGGCVDGWMKKKIYKRQLYRKRRSKNDQ